MDKKVSKLMIWIGFAFTLLGGYLLFQHLAEYRFVNGSLLVLLGIILIIGDLVIKNLGVLIPGGICLGLGGAWVIHSLGGIPYMPFSSIMLLTLTAGFLLIYLIGWRRTNIWPLALAICLGIGGLLNVLFYNLDLLEFRKWFLRWWPSLLILIGIVMVLTGIFAFSRRRRISGVQDEVYAPKESRSVSSSIPSVADGPRFDPRTGKPLILNDEAVKASSDVESEIVDEETGQEPLTFGQIQNQPVFPAEEADISIQTPEVSEEDSSSVETEVGPDEEKKEDSDQ